MALRVPNGSLPNPIENKLICEPRNFDFCRATNRNWTTVRLPVVSILDTEKYYLWMLLLRKSGAISFDDILTVNGLRCITFQQARQEYGLLRGNQQWHDALNEAAQFQSPRQLWMLFAMICGFGEVEDVPDLRVQHQVSLCEDFVHRYSEQTGPHYALADIEELLTSYNLSLQKLHLPTVDLPASVLKIANFDVVKEQAKANSYTMQLNSEQQNVVEILLSAVHNNAADTPKCYFLDGPAGTEKCRVLRVRAFATIFRVNHSTDE
ncbi:hypothetical protein AVEN_89153-1 [Araneus ventricosus]|uniref:DNA helicase n=1 Tax=Araneus ventricosus TaxID=182803 RepID=A0A4Y2B214_ARAVE|nr:hypothetical protein AVEN_89153-1 [Araneus ventricosus]